jgi:hypothetical protein
MLSAFHAPALERLRLDYSPEPAAMRALMKRGGELGISIPASFVEWFGMRDGVALLRRCSNGDHPLALDRLGEPCEWRWDEPHDLVRNGLLHFMVENQAVSIWAIRLDAGDDPPVLVARDPELEWRACADRFSTFIGCQVWDHLEVLGDATGDSAGILLLQAQDEELRDADLALLRQRFDQRPTTHGWPGDHQYRFELDEGHVLLWDGEGQADWFVAARSEAGLARVVRKVWGCGRLRETFYTNDDGALNVLKSLRRAQ